MPNVRAFRSGNWSDTNPATSPWGTGGVLYAPASNDDVYANSFTVTVDNSPTVNLVTTASTSSVAWKDGGIAAATAGGGFTLKPNQTLTATVTPGTTTSCLTFSDAGSTYVVGTINANATNVNTSGLVNNSSTGTVFVTGNVVASGGANATGITNSAGGVVNVTGSVLGSSGTAIRNSAGGTIIVTGPVEAGLGSSGFGHGINNVAAGTIQVVGNVTASSNLPAISSTNASSVVRVSGSFIHAVNGQVPIASNRVLLNTTPTLSITRYAVNGTGTYFDMFTADNNLGQAVPADVRLGTVYASGSLTGTLAVPAVGSVAAGVPVDATVGTATLTASNVRAAMGLASANLDSQLATIPTASQNATQVRTELTQELTQITETHLIHGLKAGSPLNVTPTARTAGAISQTITGDGVTTTTVTR